MALLNIQNVNLGFGGSPLLSGVNLQIEQGEKVCLVGRNGEGKSTLINLINGEVLPDDGEIIKSPGLRIATLAQEVPLDVKGPILDVVKGYTQAPGFDEILKFVGGGYYTSTPFEEWKKGYTSPFAAN